MKTDKKQKSAQDIQDEIFRKMSVDEKIACASDLWRLAKEIDAKKIDFKINRPAAFTRIGR